MSATVPSVRGLPRHSPRRMARIAGLFQALEGTASSQGQEFIRAKLIVSGNAAATATSILGHSRLFWTGFVLSAAGVAFHTHLDAAVLLPVPACKPKDRLACGVCHARGMHDSGRHRVVVSRAMGGPRERQLVGRVYFSTDPVAGLHVLEIERPV